MGRKGARGRREEQRSLGWTISLAHQSLHVSEEQPDSVLIGGELPLVE